MQSLEGLIGAEDLLPRWCFHSWLGAGCWQEASVLCFMNPSHGCLSIFNDMAVAFSQRVIQKLKYDSEVTLHQFCTSCWLHWSALSNAEVEGLHKSVNTGGEDHWGPS